MKMLKQVDRSNSDLNQKAVPRHPFAKRKNGRCLTASVVLALYGYEVIAMPLATAAVRIEASQQQSVEVSEDDVFVVYNPQGEMASQVAQRFAVSESTLIALRSKMSALGWSDRVWLIPKQKDAGSESNLYPGYVFHTLRKGETLASQALRSNRSEREFVRLNTLVIGEAGVARIKEGDTIIMPAPLGKSVTAANPLSDKKSREFEQRLAQTLSQTAQGLGSTRKSDSGVNAGNLLAQQAASGATSTLSQKTEELLSPYGRAKIGVRANTQTSDVDLEFDYLHPLLQGSDDILFGQVGARQFDDRNIGNVGMGYRKQIAENLVLGANAFIDQDFTRSHTRAGVGVEAWTEQARLAANAYAPVSGWKKSDQDHFNPDPERYDLYERPAAGWDARAEVALPGAPKIAGTVKYFQWKGEGVDTFGGGSLEKDPHGYGIGAKWQPIPLVGFNAERQQISGGDGQWSVGANLTWTFDRDLASQLNPGGTTALLPLAQARKDFVQREYNVVLDYKKQEKQVAEPFEFVEPILTLMAPNARVASPLVNASPKLRGVQPGGVVTYEKGTVTLASTSVVLSAKSLLVSVNPITGYVTVPPGISARSVEVLAHQEVDGRSPATTSYKLVVNAPVDTDGEGLSDEEEAILGTDPTKPDTDGDGFTDKEEVDAGTNPLDPNSNPGKGRPIVDVTNIQGILHVGQTLKGVYAFNANGGNTTDASTMKWLNGGHTDTDTQYTLDTGDVGKVLTFEVSAKNGAGVTGNTDSMTTANAPGATGGGITPPGSVIDPSDIVAPAAPTIGITDTDGDGKPEAAGTAEPDSTVTVTWPDGTTTDVVTDGSGNWTVEAPTTQPSGNVDAKATDPAGNTGPGVSAPWITGAPIVDVTDIQGVLHVGQVLTGVYAFNANGGNTTDASTMKWLNGGHTDTDTQYTLDTGDVGKVLTFEVSAKNGAGVTGNTDSMTTANAPGATGGGITPPGSVIDPSDIVAPAAPTIGITDTDGDGKPEAAGTAEPDSTVTVTWPDGTTTDVVTDGSGNWTVEAPTTQPSGNVDAKATDPAGNTGPGVSAPWITGAPIVDVTDIQGVLHVGQVLTGVYAFNANGGNTTDASTMKWLNGGHTDTDTQYTLDTGDVGKVLTFEVSAKNGAGVTGNTDSMTTADSSIAGTGGITPPGSVINPAGLISVVISGDVGGFPQVGSPLTAEVSCVSACSPALNYQWQIEDAVSSGSFSNAGTNSKTFTPTKTDQKRKVRVEVTEP
jgi:hypothetical protein